MLVNWLTRPGFKTSEFLITLLTAVGSVLAGTQDYVSPHTATILAAASGLAYAISRGLAKTETRTTTTTTPTPPPGG